MKHSGKRLIEFLDNSFGIGYNVAIGGRFKEVTVSFPFSFRFPAGFSKLLVLGP